MILQLPTVLSLLAWGYLAALGLGLAFRLLFQDRWWWLSLLNSFTQYWFAPLVFIFPIAWFTQQPALAGLALLASVPGLYLVGRLAWPRPSRSPDGRPTVTVMTYNLLESNREIQAIVDSVILSGADIVAFQELRPEVAAVLKDRLGQIYPYHLLEPQRDPEPDPYNGLISRLPLSPRNHPWTGHWRVPPLAVQFELGDTPLLLINFHGQPTGFDASKPGNISWADRTREQQAVQLADFATYSPEPVIAVADFNATDQNQAYRLMTRRFCDAWREGGWGLGHTFGIRRNTFGPQRAFRMPLPLPRWLLRIDYVFYTPQLVCLEARLGDGPNGSDHRPVIARISFRQ